MYSKVNEFLRKIRKKKPKEVKDYNTKEFSIKKGVLLKYRGKSEYVEIPKCVTKIGRNAFDKCKRIINVIVPEGVMVIGSEAFEDCENLKSISLPLSLVEINEEAFEGCKSIDVLIIPQTVSYIGKEAFSGFKNRQTIIIEGGQLQSFTFNKYWLSGCKANVIYQ